VRRAAIVVLAGSLLAVGIVPGLRSLNSDFPNYYVAARLMLSRPGQTAHIYDWEWFQRRADEMGVDAVVSYAPNPPLCLVPELPLAALDALTAKRVWIAVNVVLLGITIVLLAGIVGLPREVVCLLSLFCIAPLRANFLLGQTYVFLLFLVVAALWCWQRQKYVASGLLLGLGAAIKLYPILFVFYFVRKRRWTAAATLVVIFLVSLAIAAALIGIEPVQTFIIQVLPRAPRGEIINPFDLTSSSFTALFHRLFIFDAELNPNPLIASTLLYSLGQPLTTAVILSAGWFSTSANDETDTLDWALWIMVMLSISSMPVSYHLCLTIAAVVIAIGNWRNRQSALIVLLLAYIFVSLPLPRPAGTSLWLLPLQLSRLAGVVALLATVVYQRRDSFRAPKRLAAFASMAVLLAVPGAVSNIHHFSHLDAWPQLKLSQAAMNVDPAPGNRQLFFTSMTSAGYVVRSSEGKLISTAAKNTFHPAVSQSGDVWFEVLDGQSRIAVRRVNSNAVEYVTDGESPSVSPNEKWLAFVRSGQLWLRSLNDGKERQVEMPGVEVREASASDTQVTFSAENNNDASVYRVALAAGSKPELWARGARYPSLRSDDRAIAFSRWERGTWHLRVRSLSSGAEIRLTNADCNATNPAWSDDALYYASDCDRGPGLTDVRKISLAAALK
jgi:Tol biopolymer transport system component